MNTAIEIFKKCQSTKRMTTHYKKKKNKENKK